ncbi:unnamed protein product, partial [Ectocarpus sp. 12 AP-2014]
MNYLIFAIAQIVHTLDGKVYTIDILYRIYIDIVFWLFPTFISNSKTSFLNREYSLNNSTRCTNNGRKLPDLPFSEGKFAFQRSVASTRPQLGHVDEGTMTKVRTALRRVSPYIGRLKAAMSTRC